MSVDYSIESIKAKHLMLIHEMNLTRSRQYTPSEFYVIATYLVFCRNLGANMTLGLGQSPLSDPGTFLHNHLQCKQLSLYGGQ